MGAIPGRADAVVSARHSAEEVAPGVWLVRDTCNVYLVRSDEDPGSAICIDFGDGDVLDVLGELGIDRITDVLMTHHHRDQGQGLDRAVAHGARIHVPPVEVELFDRVDEMWQMRQLDNDYNLREDRFSLLQCVPVAGTVPEYRRADFGGVTVLTLPTPGHTVGSVTYLVDRGDERLAFTGDLIYAPGKVWSLAATQWNYTGHEGSSALYLSTVILARREPTVLLPSHGAPMRDAVAALELLADRVRTYVDSRRSYPWRMIEWLDEPFVRLTDHLLLNRTSMSCSYVLLSETGEALLIDYGYDMFVGSAWGNDRASRRPWLESLPALRRDFGVTRIAVALPTHYHDDHIAGMPLLREVEGTQLWIPENVAPIMADPWRHDLPCQWYDPIHADRVLPLGASFRWNEYEIGVHEQPGHTLYAAAFSVEVDGVQVVFTGDQQEGLGGIDGDPSGRRDILNYQYRNRFRIGDYSLSASLYRALAPGLLASGHWQPRWVEEGYLGYLAEEGAALERIHADLLPLDELAMDADTVFVRLSPFRAQVAAGASIEITAAVRNPFDHEVEACLRVVAPLGWRLPEQPITVVIPGGEVREVTLHVTTAGTVGRRQRLAVDATIGTLRLGQHSHIMIDVL